MLLFTYGGKLEAWEESGLLDRELAYYEWMFAAGLQDVCLMTYGYGNIQQKIDERFIVLPKKWVKHELIYSFVAPFAQWKAFRQCDVMKTNQSQGAWVGWLVKLLMPRKKLIVRCGWVRTEEMMRRDEGRSGLNLRWHQMVELLAFALADMIIVVSEIDQDYIVSHYNITKEKITIIPNSIDTRKYHFNTKIQIYKNKKRILLIGRLVEMKNFQSVLKAVDKMEEISEVVIAGSGPYRETLEEIASNISTPVTFLSAIRNAQISEQLVRSDILVLPQYYASGMPKVLLEAMAAGVPVICSDIPTHRYLIEDGVNGVLCGVSVPSIQNSIKYVINITVVQYQEMINKARIDVEANHDMKHNAIKELALMNTLCA